MSFNSTSVIRNQFRSLSSSILMSSGSRSTHMERTAHNQRHSDMMPLRISEIRDLSPTVKGFKMHYARQGLPSGSFLPGQWMDLHIHQIGKIGGYSMVSPPNKFEKEGTIDLAIKYSSWAPALWMHTKAQVNDEFEFRFGGDYHYPNQHINTDEPHRVVLIAGGVGINPLLSIAQHIADTPSLKNVETHLLYSVKCEEELIFKEVLNTLASQNPSSFTVEYFITNSQPRISLQDLKRVSESSKPVYFFLCGPSGMIQDLNSQLCQIGISKSKIFFELWT